MKTISSKLNMYIEKVSVINNNIEKLILNLIFCSFGAFALLYVLFLGNMVHNIIERRSLEANARGLSNEVRDLELTYLSMSSNVDLALSHSLGFKETKTIFATRKPLTYGYTGFRQGESFGGVKAIQNDL
ncbi:hypothetical protein A2641_02700 [Candidatus Nomurabacteria bacterium RIFCSPHIGHO2_01_FULL_37_25]|uniref:Uncharacterized protein n=1 Tax=Candidatus Nomurabacteria bacterium RIFCSPLOWO2_01_FULL_36_16 TaxID=1801767 RepID=A0A1F6X0A9_9BACT|nr:MAG: hypothetical protein A2641_02700 [Candidatus Nomurabacteria bacterium RIFCSPHIGHO2_01_FULL_37_25]OGI75060.1 MAG: hypothetical protein A3D36_03445 [Candidatus Nomurabacteria bacterium RIFCSPHIGHO2_02_FULL_36_29]OGI87571.1 MAG: hypothetical protein A3A91_01515 [Candidatus Nomurabacteria bacterium RIFCSPLOWO2_01_FULL_36_16]OGI96466.1 MAG: hypothetical protein A3I84_02850 [Candidatus Nomurabacteria bacterium RIFCSPLOWO2_02_FULL_36_8]